MIQRAKAMPIRGFLFDFDWYRPGAHRVIDTRDELTPALVGVRDAHYGSAMGAP